MFAPLHNPANSRRASARAAMELLPERCRTWACFDTAFHAWAPAGGRTYALPAWRERWACGATASMACRTRTRRGAAAELLGRAAATCAWSPVTSAPALPWPRSRTGARSTRRWASRRSRAWSWRRARGASTRPRAVATSTAGMTADGDRRRTRARVGAARPRRHRATCASRRRAAGGDERGELAFDVYFHRCGRIAAMAAALGGTRRARVHRRRRRESAPESALAPGWAGFLGAAVDAERNAPDGGRSRDQRPADPRCACSSSPLARTSRSPVGSARSSGRAQARDAAARAPTRSTSRRPNSAASTATATSAFGARPRTRRQSAIVWPSPGRRTRRPRRPRARS